jgi:ribosome-binding factor A
MAKKERRRQVKKAAQKIAGQFFGEYNPQGQLVTVCSVKTNEKLSCLEFFVSIMPETTKKEDHKRLEDKLPQLRKRIGDAISFRKVPEVRLSFAQRTDAQERVEQILDKAKDGE